MEIFRFRENLEANARKAEVLIRQGTDLLSQGMPIGRVEEALGIDNYPLDYTDYSGDGDVRPFFRGPKTLRQARLERHRVHKRFERLFGKES